MTETADKTGKASPGIADGYSCARDYQLFGPGPKRVLALDGGGVRGAITVAFLERIEALAVRHHGRPVRLGDYFHLVGGTSTGAMIAGALALGHSAAEIKKFYLSWHHAYSCAAFGEFRACRPSSTPARCGRRSKRSSRTASSQPRSDHRPVRGDQAAGYRQPLDSRQQSAAPYWESTAGPRRISGHTGNRHYRLANLVRASTAAPHYFDPEVLAIIEDERQQPLADLNARLAAIRGFPCS